MGKAKLFPDALARQGRSDRRISYVKSVAERNVVRTAIWVMDSPVAMERTTLV